MSAEPYSIRPVQIASPEAAEESLVQIDAPSARKLRNALLSVAGGLSLEAAPEPSEKEPAQPAATATGLEKLYPVLLVMSLLMAAVFCLLYLTKPVVQVQSTKQEEVFVNQGETHEVVKQVEEPVYQSLLSPWPDEEPLSEQAGNTLQSDVFTDEFISEGHEGTNLKMQQVFIAEGPGGQREKIEIEQVVNYPTRLLRWDSETIAQARFLKQEMARHLNDVQIVRQNGEYLMAEWEKLITGAMPIDVLRADSPSLPNNAFAGQEAHAMSQHTSSHE